MKLINSFIVLKYYYVCVMLYYGMCSVVEYKFFWLSIVGF